MKSSKAHLVVEDTYAIGKHKIQNEENIIFKILLDTLPNHRIGKPTHPFRSYYTTWIDADGQPYRNTNRGDVGETKFGILGQKAEDKRLRFFDIPIGFLPPSALIASVEIEYEWGLKPINSIKIKVFGEDNKEKMVDFAKKLQATKLVSKVSVKVVTKERRLENESYETFWE